MLYRNHSPSDIDLIRYYSPDLFQVDIEELGEEETIKHKDRSKSIVWSISCVIHELFTGEKPWSKLRKTLE